MVYFLIILVVALAAAPLLHFAPSRRQRHQARLREAAAIAGLFVEFRDLPLPEPRLQRLPAADRQVLYYGRRLRASRGKESRKATAWWRDGDGWDRPRGAPEAPAWLQEVPPEVLALGSSEASCGCYWREEGGAEAVEEIAELLLRWSAQLEGNE